jgi:hypothetical protein
MKITKYGGYLRVDTDGYLINQSKLENITPPWLDVVNATVAAYKKHFGSKLHSVYVRGSVAKGQAIEGVSDVDTKAVVDAEPGQIDLSWAGEFNKRIKKQFPAVTKVEITADPLSSVQKRRDARILIKVHSVCVYGHDLAPELLPLKPGKDTAIHVFSLSREVNHTIELLEQNPPAAQVKTKCSWIMKRLLRAGAELVAERSQLYTRDLYYCYELVAKYYPDKAEAAYQTLQLALEPIEEPQEVIEHLQKFGRWMGELADNYAHEISAG